MTVLVKQRFITLSLTQSSLAGPSGWWLRGWPGKAWHWLVLGKLAFLNHRRHAGILWIIPDTVQLPIFFNSKVPFIPTAWSILSSKKCSVYLKSSPNTFPSSVQKCSADPCNFLLLSHGQSWDPLISWLFWRSAQPALPGKVLPAEASPTKTTFNWKSLLIHTYHSFQFKGKNLILKIITRP